MISIASRKSNKPVANLLVTTIVGCALAYCVLDAHADSLPESIPGFMSRILFGKDEKHSAEYTETKIQEYQELRSILQVALKSEELARLQSSSFSNLPRNLKQGLELAEGSYKDGDIDNAIRLLTFTVESWRTALATLPAVSSIETNGIAESEVHLDRKATAAGFKPEHDSEKPLHATQPETTTNPTNISSPEDTISLKQQYASLLTQINEILQTTPNLQLVPGNKDVIAQAQESLFRAEQAHAGEDYQTALRLINQSHQTVLTAASNEKQYLDLHQKLIKESLDSEDVESANEFLATIVQLRPDDPQILQWQQKIERLSKLLQARNDAKLARQANNLQSEAEALTRVLAITPNDNQVARRIENIRIELRDRQLRTAIGNGFQALSQGDVNQARKALSEAKLLSPSHPQIAKLDENIQTYERNKKISDHLAAAQHSANHDDWEKSATEYNQILKLNPQHNEAFEKLKFAIQMVATQRLLDGFLAQPDRLSYDNISQAADKAIEQAKHLGLFSARLETSRMALRAEIAKWTSIIPVRIISDGETVIGIRGLGVVGQVADRIIELKPGKYVFEGKRKGYQSILVELNVDVNPDEPIEITVICDEPI